MTRLILPLLLCLSLTARGEDVVFDQSSLPDEIATPAPTPTPKTTYAQAVVTSNTFTLTIVGTNEATDGVWFKDENNNSPKEDKTMSFLEVMGGIFCTLLVAGAIIGVIWFAIGLHESREELSDIHKKICPKEYPLKGAVGEAIDREKKEKDEA